MKMLVVRAAKSLTHGRETLRMSPSDPEASRRIQAFIGAYGGAECSLEEEEEKDLAGKCGTCRHWASVEKVLAELRSAFLSAKGLISSASKEAPALEDLRLMNRGEKSRYTEVVNRAEVYGRCSRVTAFDFNFSRAPLAQCEAWDDMYSGLRCKAEFGCVLWEAAPKTGKELA